MHLSIYGESVSIFIFNQIIASALVATVAAVIKLKSIAFSGAVDWSSVILLEDSMFRSITSSGKGSRKTASWGAPS